MGYDDYIPFYGSNRRNPPAQLRKYLVETADNTIEVEAHFMFHEDGGLMFRRYIDDNPENRTNVVALFAPGYWQSVTEKYNGERSHT